MAQRHLDARIQWKRDTSSNWTSINPVLLNGEIIIVDTDSGETRFKIGDGTKTYTQLPFEDEVIRSLINEKVAEVVDGDIANLKTDINTLEISVDELSSAIDGKLDVPETAQVGQVLQVSAVDENGIVTAVGTVDVSDEDDALDLLYEMEVLEPAATEDGSILTLESGEILLL